MKEEVNKNYYENKLLINSFRNKFLDEGFIEVGSRKISTPPNKTTRFIGSSISLLFPYLFNNKLTNNSYFNIQACIRTRNLDSIYNESLLPKWGSHFSSLCLLTSYNKLQLIFLLFNEFLTKTVDIDISRLVYRVSSTDEDLLNLLKNNVNINNIEIDAYPINYYRHVFGQNNIYGRNLNYGIIQKDNNILDIGNLIIIEENGKILGIEIATGIETLRCRKLNLKHPIECSTIADIIQIQNGHNIKLADSIITTIAILREGIIPSAYSRGLILRKYLQSINYLRKKSNYSVAQIQEIISKYENLEYGKSSNLSINIGKYIEYFDIYYNSTKNINISLRKHINWGN